MRFVFKHFDELSVSELFEIYRLRAKVFVVEQNCAYQDPDEKDNEATHVMMVDGKTLAGYSRILAPGISYNEPSIGRVVVEKNYRGSGSGQLLMKQSIRKTLDMFKDQDIVISAQSYLINFYKNLGFIIEGSEYAEDDIPHIQMRYRVGG